MKYLVSIKSYVKNEYCGDLYINNSNSNNNNNNNNNNNSNNKNNNYA